MALRLVAPVALIEDPDSVPNTHMMAHNLIPVAGDLRPSSDL